MPSCFVWWYLSTSTGSSHCCWGRLFNENICAQYYPFWETSHIGCRCSCSSLLLLLLTFLVFFFLIRGGLSVIISEVDLVSEFDTKWAPLNPGCLRFQGDRFCCKLLKHTVVNAWDHIRRFDKWEWERWLQVDTCCEPREGKFNISHLVTQTLLLWKDWQLHVLLEI